MGPITYSVSYMYAPHLSVLGVVMSNCQFMYGMPLLISLVIVPLLTYVSVADVLSSLGVMEVEFSADDVSLITNPNNIVEINNIAAKDKNIVFFIQLPL